MAVREGEDKFSSIVFKKEKTLWVEGCVGVKRNGDWKVPEDSLSVVWEWELDG